jgi:hypothetical protein
MVDLPWRRLTGRRWQLEICLPAASAPAGPPAPPGPVYRVECALADLVCNADFLDAYVRTGELTAVSVGTSVDHANTVAILPRGVLLITVDVQTYQTFGLVGRHSTLKGSPCHA